MRSFYKKALDRADDVLAPSATPPLLSSDREALKPHELRCVGGRLQVGGASHSLTCAMVRIILRVPHYMLSEGVAQPLVGSAVRCDCGGVVHVPR